MYSLMVSARLRSRASISASSLVRCLSLSARIWRILRRMVYCNWRTRSRVIPRAAPTSSRVFERSSLRPKRMMMIWASRSSNRLRIFLTSSMVARVRKPSEGVWADSSPMSSPSSVVSSIPTVVFREAGRMEMAFRWATLFIGKRISALSSSFVASRRWISLYSASILRMREIFSTRWTGSRIVLLWLARARLMDCLIHQAA